MNVETLPTLVPLIDPPTASLEGCDEGIYWETFYLPEIRQADVTPSLALIEKLNLTGQRSLISKIPSSEPTDPSNPNATPSPTIKQIRFRRVTTDELSIITSNYTSETPLSTYSLSPIPLPLLSACADAIEMGLSTLLVRHPEDHPDPFILARPSTSWGSPHYLIGRWASSPLPTFDTLYRRAVALRRAKLLSIQHEISLHLSRLGTGSPSENCRIPSFYGH